MSCYYLTDRNLNTYSSTSSSVDELKKKITEHQKNGRCYAKSVIVKSVDHRVGFKINACHFPDINAFWPPKKDKYESRIEVFGWSIFFEHVYHDFFDHVVFDPLGEYKPGEKVDAICERIKRAAEVATKVGKGEGQ